MLWFISSVSTGILHQMAWEKGYSQTTASPSRILCRRAGAPEFGYHAWRHLTASILAERGTPWQTFKKFLGYKRPTTTDKFLQSEIMPLPWPPQSKNGFGDLFASVRIPQSFAFGSRILSMYGSIIFVKKYPFFRFRAYLSVSKQAPH
ncbi:MAG: hypothetical protein ABIG94_03610 [Pseudomonadota bacterium]